VNERAAATNRSCRLAVVVVNYNGGELLLECVTSLLAAAAAADSKIRLVIVDNASEDGSATAAAGLGPVEVVAMATNGGFGSAANAGIDATSCDWVALVNPDATVAPDALAAFLELEGGLPANVGVVAPQIRFASDRMTLNSAGLEVDELGAGYGRLVGHPATDADEPAFVFAASGTGAFLRRSMLDEVGHFDERYFLYFEDVDLCWRAQARGWKALYQPEVVIYHQHSAFTMQNSPLKFYHVGRNRIRTLAKNAPTPLLRRHALRMLINDTLYVLYVAIAVRSLAPLRGRIAGLRDWRAFRAEAQPADVPLAPANSLGAAMRRRRVASRNTYDGRPQ
jgi:GT2 family glycosyltransferase